MKTLQLIFLLSIALGGMGLVGACSSQQTESDEYPTETATFDPAVPEIVPLHSDVLVRVDSHWAKSTLAQRSHKTTIRPAMMGHGGLLGEFPAVELLAEVIGELVGEQSPIADLIRRDEPMWLAISWDGADEMIADLELGITPQYTELTPMELAGQIRFVIPTTDAEKMRGGFEAECGASLEDCPIVHELSTDGEYIALDMGLSPDEPMATSDDSSDENTLLDRDTPAVRAFLDGDVPLAVYMNTDSIVDLSVLSGSRESSHAIERATPDGREIMWHRGMSMVVDSAAMNSPRATEFEDLALLIGNEDSGYFAELHQTHSELGVDIFEANQRSVELPSLQVEDPAVVLEWRAPSPNATRVSVEPQWMANFPSSEQGLGQYAEFLRNSGIWGYFYPVIAYPTGWVRGLARVGQSGPPQLVQGLAMKDSVVAARASFEIVPDETQPTGYGIEGGLVIAAEADGQGAGQFRTMIAIARQMGVLDRFGFGVSEREQGEYVLFLVGSGDHDETFGEAQPVEKLQFGVDLEGAQQAVVGTPAGRGMSIIASMTRQFALTRNVDTGGAVTRVDLSRVEGVMPTLFEATAQPVAISEHADCYQSVVRQSRHIYQQIEMAPPGQQEDVVHAEATQLADGIEACKAQDISDDEAQRLDAMGEYWSNFTMDDIISTRPEQ